MDVTPLGPVAGAHYLSNNRVDVIVGPVGSAKSTASCLRLARHAYTQTPGADGVRRTRFAIVRNTKPQLRDTVLKTWLRIFPENFYGEFRKGDFSHTWRFTPAGDKHPIEVEYIFRALDDEADVANLLSLEVTGFYFNEVREIPEAIVAHAGRRAGRYPSGDYGTCTWHGWFGDSNPWDVEHYLHERMVVNPREDWVLRRQPGGMDENAENLENLNQTAETLALPYSDPVRREQGRGYYREALKDFSPEDARVYVHA